MMFRDMVDPDAGWRLRYTLQTESRIVLLASATSRFDEIDNPDSALYELLRVHSLAPLDTGECKTLWQTASGESASREKVRPLEILTGGSPAPAGDRRPPGRRQVLGRSAGRPPRPDR